jgi:hypothetical protein
MKNAEAFRESSCLSRYSRSKKQIPISLPTQQRDRQIFPNTRWRCSRFKIPRSLWAAEKRQRLISNSYKVCPIFLMREDRQGWSATYCLASVPLFELHTWTSVSLLLASVVVQLAISNWTWRVRFALSSFWPDGHPSGRPSMVTLLSCLPTTPGRLQKCLQIRHIILSTARPRGSIPSRYSTCQSDAVWSTLVTGTDLLPKSLECSSLTSFTASVAVKNLPFLGYMYTNLFKRVHSVNCKLHMYSSSLYRRYKRVTLPPGRYSHMPATMMPHLGHGQGQVDFMQCHSSYDYACALSPAQSILSTRSPTSATT